MGKPRGITVKLYVGTQTGTDAFNAPIYTESMVEVGNVLVAPESSSESVSNLSKKTRTVNLHTKKLRYTLAIPKGDSHVWEGNRVEFFGQSFRVVTKPTEGIEELVPLAWNRKVTVELIE